MKSIKKALVALWKEDEGLTMVEYAVAGGLVTAGAVVAFKALGTSVGNMITYLSGVITAAIP